MKRLECTIVIFSSHPARQRLHQSSQMSISPNHVITNPNPPCAPGVELSEQRKKVVGSVIDLFQAKPSLYKLSFWTDDAIYEDP
jgi:hypothetical protein